MTIPALPTEKPHEQDTTHIEKAIPVDGPINLTLDKRLNRKFDTHILP